VFGDSGDIMGFTSHEYVGVSNGAVDNIESFYEEVSLSTLAFITGDPGTYENPFATGDRNCWYSNIMLFTNHINGVTYYSSGSLTLIPSSVSNLVGIYINGVDDSGITGIGTYKGGNGSACFYESGGGAGDYTPSLDGYNFTPPTETASSGLGIMTFSATAGESPPEKATVPSPVNAATDQSRTVNKLTWVQGNGADYERVYFGKTGNVSLVDDDNTTQEFSLSFYHPLDFGTTYQWRIDSVNDEGTTTGDTWSFTTLTFNPPTVTGVKNREKRLIAVAENRFWYEDI